MWLSQIGELATFGCTPTGFAGIGKEGHWWFGPDENDLFETSQRRNDLFGKVRNALHSDAAGTAFRAWCKGVTKQPGPRLGLDATGGLLSFCMQRRASHQNSGLLAVEK